MTSGRRMITKRGCLKGLGATAVAVGATLVVPAPTLASGGIRKTVRFGGGGGHAFDFDYPGSLGLRAGNEVDALIMNGVTYGGIGGGHPIPELTLSPDDYWAEFHIRSGGRVDRLGFKSHYGLGFEDGGWGGDDRGTWRNIRILRIGGRCGDRLDAVEIDYIEGYQPSTAIQSGLAAVLEFQPPRRKVTTFQEFELRKLHAYQRVTERTSESDANISASGKYYDKFTTSTGIKTKDIYREEISSSIQQILKSGVKIEDETSENEIAVLIGRINIMKDSDGHFWSYPISVGDWVKLNLRDLSRINGLIDMTVGLTFQTPLRHGSVQFGLPILVQ